MPFNQWLLCWVNQRLKIIAPSAKGDFSVNETDPLYDAAGDAHAQYKTFGQYEKEILLRSTGDLCTIEPAVTMQGLPKFHSSEFMITTDWAHTHTVDTASDAVYIKLDQLAKIERIVISGFMRWASKIERPDFRVIRRVSDGQAFAGALISFGEREGQMFAFVISNDRTAGIHFVQLEERHRNMIRQISLQTQ